MFNPVGIGLRAGLGAARGIASGLMGGLDSGGPLPKSRVKLNRNPVKFKPRKAGFGCSTQHPRIGLYRWARALERRG